MEGEQLKLFQDKSTLHYGTIDSSNNTDFSDKSSSKNIIFCVHGKLSGCCTFLHGTEVELDHCHINRNEEIDKKARRKLIIASILCVFFMILEIVGGVLSKSLAIATDAAHLLTDFASFMISLFSIWLSSRPPTKKMPFGWYRAEVIGALSSVLLIWIVTGILFFLAVERIIYKDFELNASIMLITSAIGIVVNVIMGMTLHEHGHSTNSQNYYHNPNNNYNHDGNREENINFEVIEQITRKKTDESSANEIPKQNKNINIRAAFVHVVGDFIQSAGVFVAAIIIYFKPNWNIVDPICTFLFSILVIATTVAIIKDVINVLMEGIPKGFDYSKVENILRQIDGVVKVHNLRIWALSLDKTALSAHLAIKSGIVPQTILRTATKNIHEKYSFYEMTLQIEEFNENMENCNQCKLPLQ